MYIKFLITLNFMLLTISPLTLDVLWVWILTQWINSTFDKTLLCHLPPRDFQIEWIRNPREPCPGRCQWAAWAFRVLGSSFRWLTAADLPSVSESKAVVGFVNAEVVFAEDVQA